MPFTYADSALNVVPAIKLNTMAMARSILLFSLALVCSADEFGRTEGEVVSLDDGKLKAIDALWAALVGGARLAIGDTSNCNGASYV